MNGFKKLTGLFSLSLSFLLYGCGDSMKFFEQELQKYGYIRYKTPMQDARTGTLVGGTPDRLAFVSFHETCFPETVTALSVANPTQAASIPTNLRFRDDTTLPQKSQSMYFSQDLFVSLAEGMSAGSPAIKLKLSNETLSGVSLEMKGAHIEYMDAIKLTEFYRSPYMNPICKDYLDSVAFVTQTIQVDEMSFTFFDKTGGALALTVENIEQFLDINVDLKWRIERKTSLIISSPKYIGYQLGALRKEDNAMALYRATKVRRGQFDFEKIYVFDSNKFSQYPVSSAENQWISIFERSAE